MEDSSDSLIQRSFRGSAVLVTGSTGFLGKLLVEKLLRVCQDIKTIYVLLRPKKGKTGKERHAELFDGPIFDEMKAASPEYASKVKLVSGDCSLPELGLSVEDSEMLCQDVDFVFHVAATVRFDDKLKTAVHINVRGTKCILQLAKNMVHLKSFLHVSTAYANCPSKLIEEKFYEPPLHYEDMLQIVDMLPDDVLEYLTPILLGEWPNTYAFTKVIAEHAVRELGKGLPIALLRPAIVISTAKEPIAGWVNNVYGPTGVTVGAGMGLLRTMYCDADVTAELIPADMVINIMIATAWKVAANNELKAIPEAAVSDDIPVFNYVSSVEKRLTWGKYMKYNEVGTQFPSMRVLWYYYLRLDKYKYLYYINSILLHFLPALIVDTGARLIGKEAILWNAYKKIHRFIKVISYFSLQEWKFTNDNTQMLWKEMSPQDKKLFDFNIADVDWEPLFKVCMMGIRHHLGQDPPENLEQARKRYHKLKILHFTVVYGLLLILVIILVPIVLRMMNTHQ